ncbi:MAG: hypothetical protein EBZ51_06610 [Synechococcaceae bacterium WB9_2_112]|nr:hypothetical protein [Synechococcaceae bacterium WB9_2_112]
MRNQLTLGASQPHASGPEPTTTGVSAWGGLTSRKQVGLVSSWTGAVGIQMGQTCFLQPCGSATASKEA